MKAKISFMSFFILTAVVFGGHAFSVHAARVDGLRSVIPIKQRVRSLSTYKHVSDEAIARLETWKYNGNGYTGLLTIQSLSGAFTGTIVLDADPTVPRPIEGSWDQSDQRLTFQLQLPGTNRHQFYTGFVSTNVNAGRVLAGTFTDDSYPAGTAFGWFASP